MASSPAELPKDASFDRERRPINEVIATSRKLSTKPTFWLTDGHE